jgi:16S rRNA G966 N2-methylase RsmD
MSLERLESLENLQRLERQQKLQSLERLENLDRLQSLERLENLQRQQKIQELDIKMEFTSQSMFDFDLSTYPIEDTIVYIDPPYEDTM